MSETIKDVKSLILVEQLPKIKATLNELSEQVKVDVAQALTLVCTEDTVKDVKSKRAELKKQFNELEEQRKYVKNAIMSKYDEFNEIYTETVGTLYKNADAKLKEKIDNVENELKERKEEEVREFADEYIVSKHLENILDAEKINLNITLSVSVKKLKEEILEFINKVESDVKMIELEEYKDEILVEYKSNLNFAESKLAVINRHKMLEEMKKEEAVRIEAREEDKQVVEMIVEEIKTPIEVVQEDEEPEQQMMVVAFQVTATKEQIKELKQYLIQKGIKYE